jgi:hypothetical protein
MALIRSFRWQFLYVPNIPHQLFDVMDSFMQYLVGIHASYEQYITEWYDMYDKVLVNIDEDIVKVD